VLLIHGERDPLPVGSAFDTAELIPGARVDVVPDCGHFVWFERPGAVRASVARFVES
jgi:pimeloyl-ACP methyl ester carboxylesterase